MAKMAAMASEIWRRNGEIKAYLAKAFSGAVFSVIMREIINIGIMKLAAMYGVMAAEMAA